MSFEQSPIHLLHEAGPPDFVERDPAVLLRQGKAHFEDISGRALSDSHAEMYVLETIAYMVSLHAAKQQQGFQDTFVAYAQDARLDLHGADRNTPRLQAAPATTTLRFEVDDPAPAQITIPSGTRVSDAGGLVQFLTLNAAYIEAGGTSVDVPAEASAAGSFANGFPIDALGSLVDPVPGVSRVRNLNETGAGADREDAARYRARLPLAFERIGDGLTHERYVTDVLNWNARCIDVAVIRPQPGHADIYPLMDAGAPNAQEQASLQAVFDGSNTHQGDFIQIHAPGSYAFSAPLHLVLSDPDAADPAVAAVETVLSVWRRALGGVIAPSQLSAAAKAVPGVIDANLPGLNFARIPETSWREGSISDVVVEPL